MSFVVKDSSQDMIFGQESIKLQNTFVHVDLYFFFNVGVGSHI